ncbi:glycoside hydrolase family 88 protein [Saliphagus sp. LR7]|uniref:glycoside hydrolase family 88 protein n=1 Tax=Saliphagus sp. LR7 TaxID=2282654 RepID=UPI000DF7E6DB|nr:glycoside hydrolase family 88 protein [Saliphagus sp. LR7]
MTANLETLDCARDALIDRVDSTLKATGEEFPYFANPETGTWDTTDNGNWCGGHWIGLLWFAAGHADDETRTKRFAAAARSHSETMAEYMPRASMFCGMNFHLSGFKGYDATGDRALFGLGLEGADAMVAAFDETARQVPLGQLAIKGPDQFRGPESSHGPPGDRLGAVDAVHTSLPVLWRAYAETSEARFRDIAVSHADRHLDWYVREDGSTWHHAVFEGDTGELERQYNELALSDDTCWARGQGWHIAGLARAYAETGARRYLNALRKSVNYHRKNAPSDGVPQWDYAAGSDEPRDTSAAALVAYGLTILPSQSETADLREYGREILATLIDGYLVTDTDANNRGAVLHGCFNRPGQYADDHELLWTNYYVAATITAIYDQQ